MVTQKKKNLGTDMGEWWKVLETEIEIRTPGK